MKTRIAASAAVLALVALAALPLWVQAMKPAQTISTTALEAARIVGPLGSELGQFVTIAGRCVPDPSKAQATLIKVASIDGKQLATPVTVEVESRDATSPKLMIGDEYTLRGYEWGAMDGWPVDPEHPVYAQSRNVSFRSWFVATSAHAEQKPAAAD